MGELTRFSNRENPSCPKCGSKSPHKCGKRAASRGIIQDYQCTACGAKYAEPGAKYFHYPPAAVANALMAYHLGHTLTETAALTARRHKISVPETTIHAWVKRYAPICTFSNLRKRYKIVPEDLMKTRRLEHGQAYDFKYHNLKMGLAAKKFPALKSYLKEVYSNCPKDIFLSGNRCSQARYPAIDAILRENTGILAELGENNATKLAQIALSIPKKKVDRHSAVENMLLMCDSATVAVEVPVWLYPAEIPDFGIPRSNTISGHIDILQERYGNIHILDYKPEMKNTAATVSQLCLYAIALSTRTNIRQEKIKCAFFNEKRYVEFMPAQILKRIMAAQ